MKNLFLLFSLISLSFFSSCEKEVNTPDTANLSSDLSFTEFATVKNGMLVFTSPAFFDKTLKDLEEKEVNGEPIEFDIKFHNFISSRQAFDLITEGKIIAAGGKITPFQDYAFLLEKNGETYWEPLVDDNIMAQFINKEGWFGIGDKVFKATPNYHLELNARDYDPSLSLTEVEAIAIKKHEIKVTLQEKYTAGYCSKVYDYNNGYQNKKLVSEWIISFNPLGGGYPDCYSSSTWI